MDSIAAQIAQLQPWVTKFSVLGQSYGGTYDALYDDRISRVPQFFPQAWRILELGCLEGAHTVILSRAFPLADIVAVDAREGNLQRARFLTGLHGCTHVSFECADLEAADVGRFGEFDLCVCAGLLYHLQEPWNLLRSIGRHAGALWLWTVVCEETRADASAGGYRGRIYREGALDNALSALRTESFFPTIGSLFDMLREAGFADLHAMDFETTPDGPSVLLACRKQAFRPPGA